MPEELRNDTFIPSGMLWKQLTGLLAEVECTYSVQPHPTEQQMAEQKHAHVFSSA